MHLSIIYGVDHGFMFLSVNIHFIFTKTAPQSAKIAPYIAKACDKV